MSRVSLLARLQAIDGESDALAKRLEQIEKRLAEDSVTSLRVELDAEEKHLAEQRAALRSGELEVKSLEDKIRQNERRLYGGAVSNPKELEGIEKDLAMHQRQRSALEDHLLELMDSVDQSLAQVTDRAGRLKRAESERIQEVDQLKRERDAALTRQTRLAQERERVISELDADALRTFQHLWRTKAGRAVAPLRGDACSACGVAVPTGLLNRVQVGDELVFCSACGRILAA
jgi:hypothetical protein